jgi:hypothetical protein
MDSPEEDSYIYMPVRAVFRMRFAPVHGRHHIPTLGTLFHRKRWYSAKARVWFLPSGQEQCQTFTTDWITLFEIINAKTLAEARALISLCLPDPATPVTGRAHE